MHSRIAITLGLCGLYFAMSFIPSPIVFAKDAGISLEILQVGLAPVISAFFLVELLSFVPPLRQVRFGGTEGRATLNKLSLGLAVILCLFYSNQLLEQVGKYQDLLAGRAPDWFEKIAIILSFTAASFLAYGIAQAITRFGFGNG